MVANHFLLSTLLSNPLSPPLSGLPSLHSPLSPLLHSLHSPLHSLYSPLSSPFSPLSIHSSQSCLLWQYPTMEQQFGSWDSQTCTPVVRHTHHDCYLQRFDSLVPKLFCKRNSPHISSHIHTYLPPPSVSPPPHAHKPPSRSPPSYRWTTWSASAVVLGSLLSQVLRKLPTAGPFLLPSLLPLS